MATTWDTGNSGTSVTFSGGFLTATVPGGTSAGASARSTTSFSAGKKYAEATFVAVSSGFDRWYFGLANGSFNVNSNFVGVDANGVGYDANRSNNTRALWYANGFVGGGPFSGNGATVGDDLAIAVDFGAGLAWWRNLTSNLPKGAWDPSGDPNTGAGGFDFTTANPITTPLFLAWTGTGVTTNDTITLNPGPGGLTGSVPTGFSTWDAAPVDILYPQACM
jgi:hypothetical protein